MDTRHPAWSLFLRGVIIACGAAIAAAGILFFLVPNNIVDGGVVGLSIMGAHLTDLPIGVFLLLLNIPFIWLGYQRLGRTFALSSLFGVVVFALLTVIVHPTVAATSDLILAAIFGGVIVGIGVGVVIRYGGTLDGTEIVAIIADKKSTFSVGEVIMFINLFILASAGFVFGWDRAMYSLIAFFVAHKVVDVTVEGLDESKSVWIVSRHHVAIGKIIEEELHRKVTYVSQPGQSDPNSKGVLLSVITRLEEQKLKSLVQQHDPSAFLAISSVHEVVGKKFHTVTTAKSRLRT